MRKTIAVILGTVITSIATCALVSAQSGPKRRTPVLTSEDLGSARAVARLPVETEPQPSRKTQPEAVRGPIAWQRDIQRAFDDARADDKLIIADVYTDWCGWCKKMDKTIYSDAMIVALSRQYTFVKVNAEDRGQGQSFAREMGVTGYPTTIVLDAQGRVLDKAVGYISSPQSFAEFVEQARAQVK